MQKKHAHIIVGGRPLCQCGYWADKLMAELNITCGHRSIADAKRAKRKLQKHQPGVTVVVGDCPVS